MNMSRTPLIAAASLAALLTGCAADNAGLPTNRTPYSVHQPVVQRNDYILDLAQTGTGLAPSEQGRLAGWFDSLKLGYGDVVHIDGDYVGDAAIADIAQVTGAYGLLLSPDAPATAGAIPSGSVRVIVSRTTASVPGCPDFRFSSAPGGQISTPPNFGCAMNSNLAAMVADPNDLVLGQKARPGGDAANANKAVRVYRDRIPTGVDGEVKEESTGGTN